MNDKGTILFFLFRIGIFLRVILSHHFLRIIIKSLISKKLNDSLRESVRMIRMQYVLTRQNMVWVSLGENCLPDIILSRHGVKTFSTPYSHARSNIDYALYLEKNRYEGFLHPRQLHYQYIDHKNVVVSHMSEKCDPLYDELHMNGFEYTHHDIIASVKDRRSMERKVSRLNTLRGEKNFVFFYHHRLNSRSQLSVIFDKADQFAHFYSVNGKKCYVVVFFQQSIDDESQRRVDYKRISDTVLSFQFFTYFFWQGHTDTIDLIGKNRNDFFAFQDDDLIKNMLHTVANDLLENGEITESIIV